jgi:hypothetical protein
MLGTVDLRSVQEECVDREGLQARLQQLVGQPFLQFRFSYGDELSLHFGDPLAYASPKLKGLVKGSYIVGTRASSWRLRSTSPPVIVIGSQDYPVREGQSDRPSAPLKAFSVKELEHSDFVHRGARVLFADAIPLHHSEREAFGYGLALVFSDVASLLVVPESAEKPDTAEGGTADWELFTPYERYLRVGPGVRWSYLPSRSPSPSE